ncbi:ABC transporter permease [Chloroflexota bacterium]
MAAIIRKELADYFTSIRFFVLFLLVLGFSAAGLIAAQQGVRSALLESGAVTGRGFVFLTLFTTSGNVIPALTSFVGLFVPIIGIALGFDAINSERSNGTLSRLLSQPVYRDSVINGKFLAGVVTLTIMVATTLLLVSGYGLRMIGVPPTAEEIIRIFIYLVLTVIYGAFWMGLAILFSVVFRKVAASLLVSLVIWIFFGFFISIIAPAVANVISPVTDGNVQAALIQNAEMQQMLMRVSPNTLFSEATVGLLHPVLLETSMGMVSALASGQSAYMMATPLSLGQSLLFIWPHLVSLVSLSVICFAISYIMFMRQEIRAS